MLWVKKEKDKRVGIITILTLFIFTILLDVKNRYSDDIFKIKPIVDNYNVEFKSDSGFINDRFDVYSFSLKDKSTRDFISKYKVIEKR